MNKKSNYLQTRWALKGKLFESVLRTLLMKAGFSPDVSTDQLTRNLKRLHGRGSTYDPDVLGQFVLGIPFVNPILIVGEAKHYAKKVKLSEVRAFLGSYIDFSQFARVDTKSSGEARYSILYETRFTYCPIFFSVSGFQRSAEALMFVHGINYISYENSNIIATLSKLMDSVIDQINFSQFKKEDLKLFDNLDAIERINADVKKREFSRELSMLLNYLGNIDSIIGVLDLKHPVHILYERKITASKIKKVRIVKTKKNLFYLENISGRKYGEFSLTQEFIENYIKYATKKGLIDRIFRQVDIITLEKGAWVMRQLLIDEMSKKEIITKNT
jgi:hypothetical protein